MFSSNEKLPLFDNLTSLNVEWVYDGAIRTYSTTGIIGGPQGSRIQIDTSESNFVWRWNSFDIFCPATFNTDESQFAFMNWHQNFNGLNLRDINIQNRMNLRTNRT